MPATITNKFRFYNAYQFMENFKDVPIQDQSTGSDPNIGLSRSRFYIFVGKTTDWGSADGYLQPRVTGTIDQNSGSNYPFSIGGGLPGPSSQYETGGSAADSASDSNPPTPYDTIYDEFKTWDEILAAKYIESADVSFVIPRYNWVAGQVYAAFDSDDTYLFDKPFYVMNRDFRVYKCIDNNGGATVFDEPDLAETTGYTATNDGYIWKFMYSISPADVVKFVTPEWIPVKTIYDYDETQANNYDADQSAVQSNATDGDITRLMGVNASIGLPVTAGSGTDAYTVTGEGGSVSLSVEINTDGKLLTAVGSNGIEVAPIGGGAQALRGQISIETGGSVSATTRAITSPRGGHGFDAVRELGGFYVMVNSRLEYDQSGSVFVDNDFRKIGLVSDPLTAASSYDDYGSSGTDISGGLVTVIAGTTQQTYVAAAVPAGYYQDVSVHASGGTAATGDGTVDFQVDSGGNVIASSIAVRDPGSTNYTVGQSVTFALPESQTDEAASHGGGITTAGVYEVAAVLPDNTTDFRLSPGTLFSDAIGDQRVSIQITNLDAVNHDAHWDILELGIGGTTDFTVNFINDSNVTLGSGVLLNADRTAGTGTIYLSHITGTATGATKIEILNAGADVFTGMSPTSQAGGITVSTGSIGTVDMKQDTGNILYVEHRRPITRASDQIEDIKLIIEF